MAFLIFVPGTYLSRVYVWSDYNVTKNGKLCSCEGSHQSCLQVTPLVCWWTYKEDWACSTSFSRQAL